MSASICLRDKNRGFATLATVLFVGLGLSAAVVSTTSFVRSNQSNTVALHAQTQAQAKVTMGYVALEKFVLGKTKAQMDGLLSGTIAPESLTESPITFVKSPACPTSVDPAKPNYCFDITATSGGAVSVIRAIYSYSQIMGVGTLSGSVFAGGLTVGGSASFTGDSKSTIQVKDGIVTNTAGNIITLPGINVETYIPTSFVSAADLRPFANYIFERIDGVIVCKRNNLPGITSEVPCDSAIGAVTYSNSKKALVVNPSHSSMPAGVLWFKGDVAIEPPNSNNISVNTFIATGSLSLDIAPSSSSIHQFYAPAEYYNRTPMPTDAYARSCGTTTAVRPTQYCDETKVLEPGTAARAIANIVFFAGEELAVGSGNNADVRIFGNMISSTGAGGTGKASGKFTGTGTIRIEGNIIVSGDVDATEMLGNIEVTLSKSDGGGNVVPSPIETVSATAFSYL